MASLYNNTNRATQVRFPPLVCACLRADLGLPHEPVGVTVVQCLHDSLDRRPHLLGIRVSTVHHLHAEEGTRNCICKWAWRFLWGSVRIGPTSGNAVVNIVSSSTCFRDHNPDPKGMTYRPLTMRIETNVSRCEKAESQHALF